MSRGRWELSPSNLRTTTKMYLKLMQSEWEGEGKGGGREGSRRGREGVGRGKGGGGEGSRRGREGKKVNGSECSGRLRVGAPWTGPTKWDIKLNSSHLRCLVWIGEKQTLKDIASL